jgi:NADPH:quinone reductase-like Zn-dependent oxidoreductase
METIKQSDVSTAQDLISVVRDRTVDRIVVSGDLAVSGAGETGGRLLGQVKAGGIFASVLGPPQNAGNFPSVKVVPVYAEADPEALIQMAKAVVEGKLTIPIVAKMALKDASEAHILMSKGSNGKVLLVT